MAKASMRVVYYLFLLTFCIDEGDSRWKKADREILQRDINLYKEIAERVEYELEEYYEYTDEKLTATDSDRKYYHSYKEKPDSITERNEITRDVHGNTLLSTEMEYGNDTPIKSRLTTIFNKSTLLNDTVKSKNPETAIVPKRAWPKFEDILLEMGKKYDWKNDRWIKVKEKFKNKAADISQRDNSVIFHEKHHFSYTRIKLNRGKNKRNVVIAVTAIR